MEEALRELGALHARLNGAVSLVKVLGYAAEARPGDLTYAEAARTLWLYLTELSADMEECLGRAVLALEDE